MILLMVGKGYDCCVPAMISLLESLVYVTDNADCHNLVLRS